MIIFESQKLKITTKLKTEIKAELKLKLKEPLFPVLASGLYLTPFV